MKLASQASILEDLRGWINNRILRDPGSERLVSPQYLACLSTSSSKDKLAFDVGLQEHSKGESRGGFDTIVFFFRYCVVWCFKPVDGEYWRTYIFAYSWTFTYTKRDKNLHTYICTLVDTHIHKQSHTNTGIFSTHSHTYTHIHFHAHTYSFTITNTHIHKPSICSSTYNFFFSQNPYIHTSPWLTTTLSPPLKRIINSQESNRNLIHRRVVLVDHPPGQQAEVWGREGSSRWRPHSCVCCHRAISGWYF